MKSPPAEKARPLPVSTTAPSVQVGVDLREQLGQALVQLVVRGVQLLGPVQADDADRPVGLDLDLRRQVVGGHAGSPRMRRATRFRWICDVPPMTLCARL